MKYHTQNLQRLSNGSDAGLIAVHDAIREQGGIDSMNERLTFSEACKVVTDKLSSESERLRREGKL